MFTALDYRVEVTCFEWQVIDELFAYWTLEGSEDTLEDLEDALIVCTIY